MYAKISAMNYLYIDLCNMIIRGIFNFFKDIDIRNLLPSL